jgi:hypothetical protein
MIFQDHLSFFYFILISSIHPPCQSKSLDFGEALLHLGREEWNMQLKVWEENAMAFSVDLLEINQLDYPQNVQRLVEPVHPVPLPAVGLRPSLLPFLALG